MMRRPTFTATLLTAPATLRAQSWASSGPIRVIMPFAAGGTTDILARLHGQRPTETPGVSIVVENRGGGGGSIGGNLVAKAPRDGEVLLVRNSTLSATMAVMEFQNRVTHARGGSSNSDSPVGGFSA